MTGKASFRIEYVPLDEIARWPRNPKLHNLDALDRSVERFGFVAPPMIDERTGRLVAGHGRIETLLRMRERGADPPDRVEVEGSIWRVPVIRGVSFESDEEAEAYLIADNSLVEAGGWDDALLGQMLGDLSFEGEDLEVFGWAEGELERLLEAGTPGVARVPDPSPMREPVLESEVYIEIRCSRAALEALSETLGDWGERDGIEVHISSS